MSTNNGATATEIQQAVADIELRRDELQQSFDDATEELKQRAQARIDAEAALAKVHKSTAAINEKLAELHRKIESDSFTATAKVIEVDGKDLTALKAIIKLQDSEREALVYLNVVAHFIRRANEQVLIARHAELVSEAAQVDCLCAQREYEMQLKLAPIAATEGQAVIDVSQTISGELRKHSGQVRLRAASVAEELRQFQQRGGSY